MVALKLSGNVFSCMLQERLFARLVFMTGKVDPKLAVAGKRYKYNDKKYMRESLIFQTEQTSFNKQALSYDGNG